VNGQATNPPKRQRRWWQYSLRTLSLLILVLCLSLGGGQMELCSIRAFVVAYANGEVLEDV